MPVSASGENAARSSIAMRTSSSQSMSSGAENTRPASSASCASNGPSCASALPTRVGLAEEAHLQARQAVAHRIRAAVHRRQLNRVGLVGMIEHVGAIGGERQLEQRAGKRVARLDQREEAARGQVHALQRAADQADDLAHQPVRRVGVAAPRRRRAPLRGSPSARSDHGADLRLVQPQPQQRIVELAERAQRPRADRRPSRIRRRSSAAASRAREIVSSHVRLARSMTPFTYLY